MSTQTTLYRCFGCDRVTRDETKVVIGKDGYLRCAECVAYEARLAKNAESARVLADLESLHTQSNSSWSTRERNEAAAPSAPAFPPVLVRERAVKGLGPLQRKVLRTVGLNGFGHGLTPAQYRRVIHSFVARGLVEHVTDSEYRLTPIGIWAVEN